VDKTDRDIEATPLAARELRQRSTPQLAEIEARQQISDPHGGVCPGQSLQSTLRDELLADT